MLVQLHYSIQCWPGEPSSGLSVSACAMSMGTYAFNAKSLSMVDMLTALKKTHVDPALRSEKAGELDAIGAKHLNVLRQARAVLKSLNKKTLVACVYQQAEELAGGYLTVVHCIQITVVEK